MMCTYNPSRRISVVTEGIQDTAPSGKAVTRYIGRALSTECVVGRVGVARFGVDWASHSYGGE